MIAEVQTPAGCGVIGVTFCPGKTDSHAASGAWARDLDLDMDAIEAWGAVAVLTLIEDHEFETLKVPKLGRAVVRRHMDWFHLPIRDVSTPSKAFEKSWATVGAGLRARLRDGAKVLVHCRGGLGRAGTIAARMLVDLGVAPKEAITRVRAVRPGAIETMGQEAYVLRQAPLPVSLPKMSKAAVEDRAVGALVGLAVGDALGTTLEFSARNDRAEPLTDMIGGGPFHLQAGQWTDDTAMALALADSLGQDRKLDPRDLMKRFVSWWKTGEYSCTGTCFDIGITTRTALQGWLDSKNPYAGSTNPKTAGNGSLMRLAPVAIAHWKDADARCDVAARQSKTTHGAPEAVDACVLYADLVAEAIAGRPRAEILASRGFSGADKVIELAGGAWRGKPRKTIRGTGYVIDALEAAIWCVATSSDFRGAVLRAANLRDDSDTTAAIAGQLAGALYGLKGIPAEWLDRLAWRTRIEEAGLKLTRPIQQNLFDDEPTDDTVADRPRSSARLKLGGSPLENGPWQSGAYTDREKLEALAHYADVFGAADFKYGDWSELRIIPYHSREQTFEISPEIERFHKDMYDYGWVQNLDWSAWAHTPEGEMLLAGGDALDRASAPQLAKLVTTRLRIARFRDQTVVPEDIESGLMLRIARRAKDLLKRPESIEAPRERSTARSRNKARPD